MAIKKKYGPPMDSPSEYREMLRPFIQDESGIKALQQFIGPDNQITREGMYLLEILNNIIQTPNGTKNVFQRIPQEVFGGLSEGGRRNVQASLIGRAVQGPDRQESRRVHPSGYTRIQEVIGRWAERDGSWSDTPEGDLRKQGYDNNPRHDGSEARVFSRQGDPLLYKTIDFGHYSDFELMLDRIAIHNAVFPEMAMNVEGFGLRDDTPDDPNLFSQGFVVIISQPKAVGTTPTQQEIEDGMNLRFFDKSENGFFWINGHDNIVVADIHDQNAVRTAKGNLLVFDCEAFLKTFPVNQEKPERIPLKDMLPDSSNRFNETVWRNIIGDDYLAATPQDKSSLLLELRRTGKVNGLVNGKTIMMDNPAVRFRTLPSGQTERYYDGDILIGHPRAFQQEHVWKIPPLQSDEKLVNQIVSITGYLMPYQVDLEEFLYSQKWVGAYAASFNGGGVVRKEYKDQLQKTGHIEGLVNNRYLVQLNPLNNQQVLISEPSKVSFMLWTANNTSTDPSISLTADEKRQIAYGKTIQKGEYKITFDLDKGRIEKTLTVQKKLRQGKKAVLSI